MGVRKRLCEGGRQNVRELVDVNAEMVCGALQKEIGVIAEIGCSGEEQNTRATVWFSFSFP